jgi:hypothetical protein
MPPADDMETTDYEKRLIDRGGLHLQQIVGAFSDKMQTLEGEREAVIRQYANAVDKYFDEMKMYRKKRKDLGRDVTIHLPRKWYFFFLFFIVVGEFALNSQAFAVFQESRLLTYIMALTIAFGIPIVSHFLGTWIKQWPRPGYVTTIKVCVTVLVTIGGLIGLNEARRQFLATLPDQQARVDILGNAFLLINIFMFLAATIMSYFSHDQDQELENLKKRTESLENTLDRCDSRIHAIGGRIDALRFKQNAEIEEMRAIIRELVHLYRNQNIRTREDHKRPQAFNKDPVVNIPSGPEEMQKATAEEEVEKLRKRRRDALSPADTQESKSETVVGAQTF